MIREKLMRALAVVAGFALCGAASAQMVGEVEPNDTVAQADVSSVQVMGPLKIAGAIGVSLDKDVFRLTVATGGVWKFEVFDASGVDCVGLAAAMKVTLLDAAGIAVRADAVSSGIGVCPEVTQFVTPGVYYVQVEKSTAGTIASYLLECKPIADGGSEVEPNDTAAQAGTVALPSVYIFGGHQTLGDSDFYAITLTAGSSIRAEVIEGSAVETCEGNGIDSQLTLYNSAAVSLVVNDDSGRGFCSLIDGLGATPANAPAHNLAAGTYFVQVSQSTFATGADGQFDYRLVITVFGGVPVDGACCDASTGACGVMAASVCNSLGENFRGVGTVCSPSPCPSTVGACCTGAFCSASTLSGCQVSGQRFQGIGSACVANVTCCRANYNADASVNVQDIFDFLSGWFGGCP